MGEKQEHSPHIVCFNIKNLTIHSHSTVFIYLNLLIAIFVLGEVS